MVDNEEEQDLRGVYDLVALQKGNFHNIKQLKSKEEQNHNPFSLLRPSHDMEEEQQLMQCSLKIPQLTDNSTHNSSEP